MHIKTPAFGRVTRVLCGVTDVAKGMSELSKFGMIPIRYGMTRYFLNEGQCKRTPANMVELIRWASVAKRRILKIEDIAIEAMLRSAHNDGEYKDDYPCIVWGFDIDDGWIKSDADDYGVRLVSVTPYEAILTL